MRLPFFVLFAFAVTPALSACAPLPGSATSADVAARACWSGAAYSPPSDTATVPLDVHAQIAFSDVFELEHACVVLDGVRLFRIQPDAATTEARVAVAWPTRVTPGEHRLIYAVRLSGTHRSLIRDLAGYRFEVVSSHDFATPRLVAVTARAEEARTDAPLEQRPVIRWTESPSP